MNVYWDTSALVAVYIRDTCTKQAIHVFEAMTHPASSWLCFSESLAAFRACKDANKISTGKYTEVVNRFEKDWANFHKIPVKSTLSPELRRIFKHHSLRGADAIHLASALLLSQRLVIAAHRLIFACHDSKLSAAAQADGLDLAWDVS